MKVYGDIQSGNCYKIRLLMSLLHLEHEWIHVDILAGATRTAEFLAMNPNGKIPLLVLDDDRLLSESNAILNFLAADTVYLPDDRYQRAQVLQWQFFEQYSHEPYIAVARFIAMYLGMPEDRREEFESRQEGGHKALQVMEDRLVSSNDLAGDRLTIADITFYAYTHGAGEGGFDLSGDPGIRAGLQTLTAEPDYVGMEG